VAPAIVLLALVGLAEDLVRLADLLELGLSLLVVRIQIGVVLTSELAVGLPDILLRGRPWHAEYIVVVTPCHRRLTISRT
jgi:hypothetical protein